MLSNYNSFMLSEEFSSKNHDKNFNAIYNELFVLQCLCENGFNFS